MRFKHYLKTAGLMNVFRHFSWKLSFKDPNLENIYRENKFAYQKPMLIIIIFFSLLQGIISWIINPFNILPSQGIIYMMIELALIVSVCCFQRKKRTLLEYLLIGYVLLHMIALLEITNPSKDQWNHTTYFLSGITAELTVVILMIVKVCAKKIFFTVIAVNSLYFARYSNLSDIISLKYYPMIAFVLNSAMLLMATYIMELKDRQSFFRMRTYEDSLLRFKELIKDVFPNAILVLQRNEIVFRNAEAVNIFRTADNAEIMAGLRTLKTFYKDDDSKTTSLHIETTIPDKKPANSLKHDSLENLITRENAEALPNQEEPQLQNLFVTFDRSREEADHEIFELKVIHTTWEKEKAIMIIFSENQMLIKLKRLREQTRYKDSLLATVSHDLRTPLNGITGMISSAMAQIADASVKKGLKIALRSSHLLLFIINDLLDYTQVQDGRLRLNFEVFSLLDVIKDVASLIKFNAKKKGLSFIIENKLAPANRALIRSDPNRLKQILMNLLGNALKFTEKGFIKISLDTANRMGKSFNIRVEDSGLGIKKEDQARIFKIHSTAEDMKSRNINKQGLGLGLAISQSLVVLLNRKIIDAEIKVSSEYGRGSSFYFDLISCEDEALFESCCQIENEEEMWLEQGADLTITEVPASLISNEKSLGLVPQIVNVLIVDDDQINILVASSFLKDSSKYKCFVARNGAEAIATIKAKAIENFFFHVILMDCNMPIMDGFEASERINEMIKAKHIPQAAIIACTANASQSDYDLCFQKGMTDYLSKPFSQLMLTNKIKLNLSKLKGGKAGK